MRQHHVGESIYHIRGRDEKELLTVIFGLLLSIGPEAVAQISRILCEQCGTVAAGKHSLLKDHRAS